MTIRDLMMALSELPMDAKVEHVEITIDISGEDGKEE